MGVLAARIGAIPHYPSFILEIGWRGLNIGYFAVLLFLVVATGSLLLNARPDPATRDSVGKES